MPGFGRGRENHNHNRRLGVQKHVKRDYNRSRRDNTPTTVLTSRELRENYDVTEDFTWTFQFSPSDLILELGCGDFTFPLALQTTYNDVGPRYTATSNYSISDLEWKYGHSIHHTLDGLKQKDFSILHEISVFKNWEGWDKYDKLLFNFPHAGVEGDRTDKDPAIQQKHRDLIVAIFNSGRQLLKDRGVLLISLLERQFRSWNLRSVAEEYDFLLVSAQTFPQFAGYQNVYGDKRSAEGKRPRSVHAYGRDDQVNQAVMFAFIFRHHTASVHAPQPQPVIPQEIPTSSGFQICGNTSRVSLDQSSKAVVTQQYVPNPSQQMFSSTSFEIFNDTSRPLPHQSSNTIVTQQFLPSHQPAVMYPPSAPTQHQQPLSQVQPPNIFSSPSPIQQRQPLQDITNVVRSQTNTSQAYYPKTFSSSCDTASQQSSGVTNPVSGGDGRIVDERLINFMNRLRPEDRQNCYNYFLDYRNQGNAPSWVLQICIQQWSHKCTF
eukprot:gene563-7_t